MPSGQGKISGIQLQSLDSDHMLIQDGLIMDLKCRLHNPFYTAQYDCPAKESFSYWIRYSPGVRAEEAPC